MGFMTTINILNDGFDQIDKNPKEFIDVIKDGMNGINRLNLREIKNINTYGVGYHGNCVTVARSHHADEPRMYIAHQNSLQIIGLGNELKDIEYRKKNLKIAKEIIKYEEEQIKKLEKEREKENKN